MSERSELPRGWTRPTIGEVCSLFSGYGFPERLQGKTAGDLPFFKVGDISRLWQAGEVQLVQAQHYLSTEEARLLKASPLPEGTVVFAKIGAAIALNRRAILGQPSLVDNNVMGIWASPDIFNARFLYHYACTLRFGEASRASVVPSIRKSDVASLDMPMPPRDEQDRIVAKIEELFSDLDAGVAALGRVEANLKRYRASVLKAAVEGKLTEQWRTEHPDVEPASELLKRILAERRTKWEEEQLANFARKGKRPPKDWKDKYQEPGNPNTVDLPELPENWCWVTIDQITRGDRPSAYGVLQPGSDLEDGIPFVRVCDIAEGRVHLESLKRIDPAISEQYQRTILQGGEVLLTIVGTIGRSAVVPKSLKGANIARAVAVIPTSKLVRAEFVEVTLRESTMRARLTSAAHEVARKTLNLEDVRLACVPLAPLEEQDAVVGEVDQRLSIVDSGNRAANVTTTRAIQLRQAILKQAFEGKLVPQDPTDEPADVLLARIKSGNKSGDGKTASDRQDSRRSRKKATKA